MILNTEALSRGEIKAGYVRFSISDDKELRRNIHQHIRMYDAALCSDTQILAPQILTYPRKTLEVESSLSVALKSKRKVAIRVWHKHSKFLRSTSGSESQRLLRKAFGSHVTRGSGWAYPGEIINVYIFFAIAFIRRYIESICENLFLILSRNVSTCTAIFIQRNSVFTICNGACLSLFKST